MMKIQSSENPNIYLILIGCFIFFIIILTADVFPGAWRWIYCIIMGMIAGIFISRGYKGLKKIQDLKNKKIEEEINLLKKKNEEQSLINEKFIHELSEQEPIFPNIKNILKKIQIQKVKKRLKK